MPGLGMVELRDLIPELNRGEYAVPEIQRGFVWTNPKIRDLVESIFARYPIGSIVIWKLPKDFATKYPQIIRSFSEDLDPKGANYLVIDGQQRLTSLMLLFREKAVLAGDERSIHLFFNAAQPRFELGRPTAFERKHEWYSVSALMKAEAPALMDQKRAISGVTDPYSNPLLLQNLNRLRLALLGYPIHFVETYFDHPDDLDEILTRMSRMFVSLNSKGTRIRMPDLVLALLTAAVRGQIGESFRERFDAVLDATASKGFEIEDAALVRSFTAIAVGKTRFTEARNQLEHLDANGILNRFARTERAVSAAVDMLQSDLGVKSADFLYSRYYLVPIVYGIDRDYLATGRALSDGDKGLIRKWLVASAFTGRYSGELERLLGDDIGSLDRGGGWIGLNANQPSPFINETDISDNSDQRFATLLSMLFVLNGAPDWLDPAVGGAVTVSPIRLLGAAQLEVHHVFPKRFMRRVGYRGDDLDHAGNLTLISATANQGISDKDPAEYLAAISSRNPDAIAKHYIPTDSNLWHWERYHDFVRDRIALIKAAEESSIGVPVR